MRQVILKVRTQSGLVGYGECNSLSPSELKATSQVVVGRAPSAYEALNSLAPPAVRGGLNIALLDVLGKATKAPIYRVLGGPTRNKARAIIRLTGSSDDALQATWRSRLTAGFAAFPHSRSPAHCPQSGQRVCARRCHTPQNDACRRPNRRFRP